MLNSTTLEDNCSAKDNLSTLTSNDVLIKTISSSEFWLKRSVYSDSIPSEERKISHERKCALSAEHIESLRKIDEALDEKKLPDFLEIKICAQIDSYGLYTTREIVQGELIGLYASVIIPTNSALESHYRFSYTHQHGLDASGQGNYTRYINSAFSINERNLKAVLILHENIEEIAIFALKNIQAGQQCLFYYGEGYFKHFGLTPIKLTADS